MADWGYEKHNGPSHWHLYAPACTGFCQSPVDIITSQAKFNSALKPCCTKIDPSQSCVLCNNGKTVQVNITGKSTLLGGPLECNSSYILKQYHFHWGGVQGVGSEHTVDGKSYCAELHLVHWKSEYGSFEEALNHKDGLAVLAVFIETGTSENIELQRLLDSFPLVTQPSTSTPLSLPINPYVLLPEDKSRYWTYSGSLTTPPCLEVVTFIIYKQPFQVSPRQLQMFRDLKPIWVAKETDSKKIEKACLENNYRPTMLLNGRVVEASFH